MKKFRSSLREHARNILSFEKKKMLPLTKEELKLHHDETNCYICGKSSLKVKIIGKLETIVIIEVNIEVQQIAFVI